jgi:hypothetical protein
MRASLAVPFALAAVALSVAFTTEARAGIDACGKIDVSANANCKVVASGGCTAQCTPINVQAACDGKLYASCQGGCTAMVDASCTTSCLGTCNGTCSGSPGSFDCSASCKGRCEGDCSAQCQGNANQADCTAACKGNCGGECNAQCNGTPPSATCEAKCSASCSGSCTAKVTGKCQIDCQMKGEAQCRVDVQGGCQAQCTKPDGAIFCDGQYVDVGNNFKNCLDALNAILNIKVSGSASCTGNNCQAQGKVSCFSVAPGEPAMSGWGIGIGLGALGAALARRRLRNRK